MSDKRKSKGKEIINKNFKGKQFNEFGVTFTTQRDERTGCGIATIWNALKILSIKKDINNKDLISESRETLKHHNSSYDEFENWFAYKSGYANATSKGDKQLKAGYLIKAIKLLLNFDVVVKKSKYMTEDKLSGINLAIVFAKWAGEDNDKHWLVYYNGHLIDPHPYPGYNGVKLYGESPHEITSWYVLDWKG